LAKHRSNMRQCASYSNIGGVAACGLSPDARLESSYVGDDGGDVRGKSGHSDDSCAGGGDGDAAEGNAGALSSASAGESESEVVAAAAVAAASTDTAAKPGDNTKASTVSEALEHLEECYRLLLDEYPDKNPRDLFEHAIPKCIALIDSLQPKAVEAKMDIVTAVEQQSPRGRIDEGREATEVQDKQRETHEDKDAQRVILSYVTSNWIKNPKHWNEWLEAGVEKDVAKRQHEFQALLRLYLVGLKKGGESAADPLQGKSGRIVLSALTRLFVNWSLNDKLKYVEEVLKPLCSTHLPRTLEFIVESFGLTVEEDRDVGVASVGISGGVEGGRDKAQQVEGTTSPHLVPTPIHKVKSGESAWTGAGSGSGGGWRGGSSTPPVFAAAAADRGVARNIQARCSAFHAGAGIIRKSSTTASGGAASGGGGGGKVGLGQSSLVSTRHGSKCLKEMTMQKRQKSARSSAAVTAVISHSASELSKGRYKDTKAPPRVGMKKGKKEEQNEGVRQEGIMQEDARQHDVSMWSNDEMPMDASAAPHSLLNTPARCKTAKILVPETPETKVSGKPPAGTGVFLTVKAVYFMFLVVLSKLQKN
jgi:hypothetical protein